MKNGDLKARGIFEYHDGEKRCFGDPIDIQRKLLEFGGLSWDDIVQAQKETEEEMKRIERGLPEPELSERQQVAKAQKDLGYTEKLVKMARAAFNIKEVQANPEDPDGPPIGLNSIEVMGVMADYMAFTEDLKKTVESNPILQRLTEAESSSPTSEETSATKPTASFGSTGSVPLRERVSHS